MIFPENKRDIFKALVDLWTVVNESGICFVPEVDKAADLIADAVARLRDEKDCMYVAVIDRDKHIGECYCVKSVSDIDSPDGCAFDCQCWNIPYAKDDGWFDGGIFWGYYSVHDAAEDVLCMPKLDTVEAYDISGTDIPDMLYDDEPVTWEQLMENLKDATRL